MYKPLLILKYLTKRRIAWVSLIAVALCTALVLTVISVMGSWLQNFRDSFKGLSGDVVVMGQSLTGFPHYQEMIDKLEALPEVKAAVPMMRTPAIINVHNQIRDGVQAVGIPIERIALVNEFTESLFLQNRDPKGTAGESYDHELIQQIHKNVAEGVYPIPTFALPLPDIRYKMELPGSRVDVTKYPGMIVGLGVVGLSTQERGVGTFAGWARLSTLAVDPDKPGLDLSGDKAERVYWIVDDSHTGASNEDANNVYVPFDELQADLRMNERPYEDANTGEKGVEPARAHEIHIDAAPGVTLAQLKGVVEGVVAEVKLDHAIPRRFPIRVQTWEEVHGQIIGAVEKEKGLVTFLMGLISIVAVFLIFCIFYMIVVEKTRDIGILKSVGASGPGIAAIFVGYGGIIGLVGGAVGVGLGAMIVWNINVIHDWMSAILRIEIWDSQLYMFDQIPNRLDPTEVWIVLAVAVLSSVIGAIVPAIMAARLKPVEALRFE